MTDADPHANTAGVNSQIAAIEQFFSAYAANDLDGIGQVLAADIAWTIPGHHPLAGTKHGIDEVLSFFTQLGKAGFQADPIFLGASIDYVVDIHRGWTTEGTGRVDTTWALVWHFNVAGQVDRVINLSGDQHEMDAYVWANFTLAPLPTRLVGAKRPPTTRGKFVSARPSVCGADLSDAYETLRGWMTLRWFCHGRRSPAGAPA